MVKRRRKRKRKNGRKGHYITGIHTSPKAGECKYRSGWEQKYMTYLDEAEDVASYEYEGLKIPYVSNIRSGRIRNYYPDFFITFKDGSKLLVEIKPHKRLTQAAVTKKVKAAREWSEAHGVQFQVLTELELKILGIL